MDGVAAGAEKAVERFAKGGDAEAEDDAERRCTLRHRPVQIERQAGDLGVALLADERSGCGAVDVLVVTGLRLRRGGEQGLGQLGGLDETTGQAVAADLAARRGFLGAGAR